jgi:hypothetical protein
LKLDLLLKNRFTLLLLSMLLLVIVMPFLRGKMTLIVPFILIAMMLGVFRALRLPKPLVIACATIGLLATVMHFVSIFVTSSTDNLNSNTIFIISALSCYSIFLGISIFGLLSRILSRHEISHDTIRGSLAVYLLMGIFYALLYRIVYIIKPTEFAASIEPGMFPEFLYFSFTTLTTLGYGDISPVGSFSRTLTTLEAITGPVFLTVLVSSLVGHFISRKSEEE